MEKDLKTFESSAVKILEHIDNELLSQSWTRVSIL